MVILQATDHNLQRLHYQHLAASFPSTSLTAHLVTEEDFTCTFNLWQCPIFRALSAQLSTFKTKTWRLPLHPALPYPTATLPISPSAASCPRPALCDLREEGRLVKCQGWETGCEKSQLLRSTMVAFLVERQNLFSGYDDSCFTEEHTKIFPSQVCLLVNNSSC